MAPPKVLTTQTKTNATTSTNPTGMVTRRGLATRQQTANVNNVPKQQPILFKDSRIKRKADASPLKDKMSKRSALGNITNAIGKTITVTLKDGRTITKKVTVNQTVKSAAQTTSQTTTQTASQTASQTTITLKPLDKNVQKSDVAANSKSKPVTRVKASTKKDDEKTDIPSKVSNVRRSLDVEKSDDSSLYVSALETLPEENVKRLSRAGKEQDKKAPISETSEPAQISAVEEEEEEKAPIRCNIPPQRTLPDGVQWDFDVENWQDPYQVSQYAMDIFDYLKDRERLFPIGDYMEKQVCLSRWMRSLLVDWMVAVQESFELNHETLYLAVKLVDLYLTKVLVGKETLQLLGAASLFIASKYDERIPPMIEDFLYICDGAYSHRELTRMEMSVLKVMDFDLGIPLSYRFLRRYARCAKVSMPTLTLARYILEYTLMDYSAISFSDSKTAAAALYLALQMKDLGGWTATLEYYTGYKLSDFSSIVVALNEGLHRKHKEALSTVRNKYSHKIFFEVAKVPLKDELGL
ncbi:hypothetical protein QAD02_020035 [Eretmocerus hayati]|uniref:Uncharacterized protein n=1 Tax=Eretmocerus hayati TaxID=131215 RepID=A0ACC2PMD1_9HYME|nr:hypothetical protein QAD02_020035 [Eretmocerus hayati]